jgi:hypothetical protein
MTEADSFLQRFNISRASLGNPTAPNTEMVKRSLSRQLARKKINLSTLQTVSACAKLSPALYRCTYWIWQAPGRERGIEVTLVLDRSGVFQSASVLPSLRIAAPALPGQSEDTET